MSEIIKTPESSNIREYSHNLEENILTVTFKYGASYNYLGVPRKKFEAMKAAESVGKFLNAEIKPHYEFIKL